MLPWALGVAAVSALWFAFQIPLTFDWYDEGQLAYLFWRVSEGAVPHRDFHHVYGPTLFWLNGALFSLFGPEIGVLRGAVVVAKCASVAGVFLLTMRAAGRVHALGAAAVLTLVWGTAFPYFSTPYASTFSLPFGLAGMLLGVRGGRAGTCLLAGLCFGVAAAFKQTTGAFFFVAAAAFVLASPDPPAESDSAGGSGRWLAPAGLVGIALFVVALLLRTGSVLEAILLGGPALALVGALAVRALGDPAAAASGGRILVRGALLASGAALPLVVSALAIASQGGLAAFLDDTILGLPAQITLHVPPTPWHLGALLWLGLFGAIAWAARRGGAAWALVGLLAAGVVAATLTSERQGAPWQDVVFHVFALMPYAVAAASAFVLVRNDPRGPGLAVALLAAVGLLNLVPAADVWHVFLALPVFLPLLATAAGAALPSGAPARRRAALAVALVLVPLALPFLGHSRRGPDDGPQVARAAGIRFDSERDRQGAELAAFLAAAPQDEREILVLSGQAVFYFLAGRASPVDAQEFSLYLLGFDLLSEEGVRERIDEREILRALDSKRPLIVEENARGAPQRVRRLLPGVGGHVQRHYREVRRFGKLRVLDRVDAP